MANTDVTEEKEPIEMHKSNSFPVSALRRSKTADEVFPNCINSPIPNGVPSLKGTTSKSNKLNKSNKCFKSNRSNNKRRKAVHFAMHSSRYSSQYDSDIDHSVHLSRSASLKKPECSKQRSCFGMKLEACSSIQNISYILGLYHSWIRSKRAVFKKANDGMYDRIHDKNSKIKNRTQLLNDFNHILDEHTKSNRDLEIVQKYIINTASCGPCILKKGQISCTIITRHLRDTKKEEKNRDIKTRKFFGYRESSEIVTQQLLDTIHSFIYHSFDTLRFTEYEQKQIDDLCTNHSKNKNNGNDSYFLNAEAIKKAQQIIAKKKKMVQLICKYDPYKANKKYSSDVQVNNDNDYDDTEYDEKYNIGHNRNISSVTWDMNRMSVMGIPQIDTMDANNNNNNNNTLMSVYSFGKEFVYNKANDISPFHLLIKPKYKDIKDELLNNKIYRIQHKSDYNDTYEKALIAFSTDKAKKMKRRKLDDDYDQINYKNNNLFITLPHLLCIIFYTDYSNLCFFFSQTYRKKTANEKWSSVVKRHSEYYWWGLLLKETVECFGSIAKGNTSKLRKRNTFYHGLNQQMSFTTFVAQFYGPTSFTDELGIAQTFAKDQGMILSLQPHRRYPSLYFDCKWLSMHPAESEKLFIGGQNPLHIFTIITVSYPQTNHRKCLVAMMHISQMIGVESQDVSIKFKNDHKKYVKMLIENELNINNQDNDNKYMIDSFHIFCQSVETVYIDPNHVLFEKMPEIFKTDDDIIKMELFGKLFPNAREVSIDTMHYDKIDELREHSKHIFQDSAFEEWEDGLLTLSPNHSSIISLKSTDDEIDHLTQELMGLVAEYEENEHDLIIEMDEEQKQQEINQLNQWYQNDQIMYNQQQQNDDEYAADDETEDDDNDNDEHLNHMMIIHEKSDREQHLIDLRDKYIDNHTGLGRPDKPCKYGQRCKWHHVEEDDFVFLTLSQKLHGYFYHNKEYTEYEAKVRSQKYCEQHFKKEIRKSLLITPLTAYNNNDRMSVLPLLSRPSSVASISGSSLHQTPLLQKPLLQKRQSSIPYTNNIFDKPSVEYHSTVEQIAPPQFGELQFGNPWEIKLKEAKFKDPKQEILENSFKNLEKYQWNDLLRDAIGISKKREAKLIDLSIKLIVALKLYTDFDKLQDEFILTYRHEFRKQRIKRQQQFFYWNKLLEESCGRSEDIIIDKLFRGVNKAVTTSSYSGTFWGPVSCTTQFNQLNSFIGCNGTILEMYPTYSRKGLKLHWLSMFPYEKEVLYFNTSFQIANIYYKESISSNKLNKDVRFSIIGKSDTFMLDNLNEKIHTDFMEKAILRALQLINTESHIISFSDINDKDIDQISAGFNQLDGSEQIAVLYLLYLEYKNEWNTFWNELNENMKFAFAKYRDQFISLAINVTAVRMDKLSMLLQDFFCSNQDEYKFPIKGSTVQDIDNSKLEIQDKFQPNKPLNFGTIVRLFPNAQQLSINGDNFDWTLESFVQFVDQYQLDYQNVALQDIHIKFESQYPNDNNIYDDEPGSANNTPSLHHHHRCLTLTNVQATTPEDLQASKRLNQYKDESRKNIHKLMKLGWRFLRASHLTRIGFEPLPELPFFMTFVSNDKMYYRTYSQLLLNKEAFLIMDSNQNNNNNISDNDNDDDDDDEKYPESRIKTPSVLKAAPSYSRQTTNDSYYYQDDEEGDCEFPDIEYQHFEDIDMSSLNDIPSTVLKNRSKSNENKIKKKMQSIKPVLRTNNVSAPHRVSKYYHLKKSMSKKLSINTKKELVSKCKNNRRETQTEGKLRNFESNVVIDYNPRNCTLSEVVVNHTLSYKKQLIEELKWKKHHPKIKPINNKLKQSFNKYCNMVNALVLDPMPLELQPIFMKDINKGIPSFESILSIFQNISDLFLRDTQLKLKICYTFRSYLNQNENCKLQRIFFSKKQNQRLNKRDENTVKSTLNALGWDLNDIEQMIFLKEPGTPTNLIVIN